MPELFEMELDCRTERDLARKAAEAENTARSAIERERRYVAEQRSELEAQVADKEAELVAIKEATVALQEEVACAQREGMTPGALSLWPEVNEASESVNQAHSDLLDARRRNLEESLEHEHALEASKAIYNMYKESTGISWDFDSQNVEGFVALDSARHFKLAAEGDAAARADALWQEIEESLGITGDIDRNDRPPVEAIPGGA